MKGEVVFPFQERNDYGISAWTNDVINIIKIRNMFDLKEKSYLVFQENMSDFLVYYSEGYSPMGAFEQFIK